MFKIGEEINGGEKVLKAQRFVYILAFVSSFFLIYIINLFPSLLLSIIVLLYTKDTPFFCQYIGYAVCGYFTNGGILSS
jgi:hypothetical protein